MVEFELQEKIEAFLRGKMSPTEKVEFESQIRTDARLAERVENIRLSLQATDRLAQLDLQQTFLKWKSEMTENDALPQPQSQVKKPIWLGFLLFSIVVVLVLLVWFFGKKSPLPEVKEEKPEVHKLEEKPLPPANIKNIEHNQPLNLEEKPPSPKILPQAWNEKKKEKEDTKFAALAKSEHALLFAETVTRGGDHPSEFTPNALSQAKMALKNEKPNDALALLDKISDGDADFLEVLSLRGNSFFMLGNYVLAIQNFQKCLSLKPENDWIEYNLLLCYLAATPKYTKERDFLLSKITSDPQHTYHSKALQWARALERN